MRKTKKKGFRGSSIFYLFGLFLLLSPDTIFAEGIDESISYINQLMDEAVIAVESGDPGSAKTSLEYVARNLEMSSAWSAFIWSERQTNPGYSPITLNALPVSLTVSYYTSGMDASRASYRDMIAKIEEAQIAYKTQQLRTMLSLLFNAVDMANDIHGAITGNPLLLPKNLYDMNEKAKQTAQYIQNNFDKLQQGGLLVRELTKLKDEVVAIYRDLRQTRWNVEILVPEVNRIEKAMAVARNSINSGMDMPIPPDSQASFDSAPYNANLDAVEADLAIAEMAWESGLEIIEGVKTIADSVYNSIPAKTDGDTSAYNSFVSSYNTFKSSLTEGRNSKINELQALGEEWRQVLTSILQTYMNISLGNPVTLSDCSDRHEADASLVLDDSEPRAWKPEYATLLSAPTGPPIVPVQTGIGAGDWYEYTASYPARLVERVNLYGKAWQSAYSSMSYADWQALSTSVDPSQPYQILALKRGSLNILLENLNAIRSEANRYYSAFRSAVDEVKNLESDLSTLQSKADAYRQFLTDNPGTTPDFEFDEHVNVTDADVSGISTRTTFAGDGISVLETEVFIDFLERVIYDFGVAVEEIQGQATHIGNRADKIAFDINRTLTFNDSISSKLPAAKEMLDYKFDYEKDLFLGDGDHGYLFDSLEILDNDLWQHVDTWYYHANPPDIETQILPHVEYINSLGTVALNRFAYLTEQIWSITDNLTFAAPEMKPNPWSVGTGFDAGESFAVLAENKDVVDQFTKVRFLKYHKRPYTEPMGYITLDEIRKGLPKINKWVDAQTGGTYGTGLVIERVTPVGYIVPLKLKSLIPFTVRVVDSAGTPVPGVAVSLDYDAESLHSLAVSSTDEQGIAVFYPGPYGEAGDIIINFSVVYNPGGGTGPSILASLSTAVTVTADTDGDGCSDEWEILYGFDPSQAFDGEGDFDGDGLTNAQEAGLMTNPLNADTDNDSYSDDIEAAAGSDPLNAGDIPQAPAPERLFSPVMRTGVDWEKISEYIDIAPASEYSFKFQKVIPFKDRIWAFGSNEVWSSDDGFRWSKGQNIPQWAPRSSYAMTVHGDRLWLIGGIEGNTGDLLSDVWVSDDGTNWNMVRETSAFGPRRNAHVHSFGDNIWLIGGYLYNPSLELIGDQKDVWKSVDGIQWTRVTESAPWPLRRSDSFSSIVFDNKLWIMGGDLYESGTFTTYSDIWNSADGANWTMANNTPEWAARYGTGITAFSNRLWMFGGQTHTEGVYISQNELWISEDGITWKSVKGPVNSDGMAFNFKNDLWVYYDHVRHGYPMSYFHNELHRSRGPAALDSSYDPAPVVSVPATLSAGSSHVLAVKDDGTLWVWGENHKGQLGTGNTERSSKPLQVGIDTDWEAVSAGNNFSIALKTDGTLWAWGQNYYGELGDNTNNDSLIPIQVGTDTDWSSIDAGHGHALAIKTNGTLWSWGHNNGGQLGDGTKTNRNYPSQVGSDSDWAFASGGSYHSTAIKKDGSVWTWGANSYGQLGTATATESLVPFQGDSVEWAELSSGHISIYAGASFTASLRSDGRIHLWGYNTSGQIGMESTMNYYTKAQSITPYDAWAALSAGNSHTAGIKWDNTLWAWGDIWNTMPENIDHLNNTLPIPVSRDDDWVMVVSGGGFSLAQKADGSLWAWGSNGYGQLGNGTTISSGIPLKVLALGATAADTDGDWMDDDWEIEHFGDTGRDGEGDYDGDGLSDFTEFRIGALPDNKDTDGDGMPDKWEIDMGTNPLLDDAGGDQDNDGLTNLDEYRVILFRSANDTNWGEIRWFGVSGSTLYFVDAQDSLLKAYDMTNPDLPVLLGAYSESLGNSGGLRIKDNLLVIADGNGNFQIIDIANPSEMTKAGEYILGGYIQGFDVSDTHICAADSDGALRIIDISDPASPVLKATYRDNGYFGKVFISGNKVYATLGGNLIQIIDIEDSENPILIGSYDAGDLVWPPAIAFSGTVMAAAVRPWEEGASLKFIGTSDPQAMTEIGKYPYFVDYIAMSEGLLIASTGTVLDVVDARNPANPVRIADIGIRCGYGSGLLMSGNMLFISHDGGVAIVDLSRFRRPFIQAERGDVNHSETVDLSDAILVMQVLAQKKPQEPVYKDADVNNDGKLGMEEILFILRKTVE
ncbi:MAG: hypothetical protein M0P57_12985 [Syntrophales bacterium]|nr:hypothetical protein [Syntrophales bacterium]